MGLLRSMFTAGFACFGSFLFGYDSGVITNVIAQEHFVNHFDSPSAAVQGAIVSTFQGGAVLGCVLIFYAADPLGRTRSIFLGSVIVLLGSALQTGCTSLGMLIAGRLIAGIAIGILSSIIPVYCAEIAPPSWRGPMIGLQQFLLSFGFFFAQWIGYGSSFADSDFQWRFPLGFQCIPAILLCLGILFQVESPRWLMKKGRVDKAKEVLYKLHYNGYNQDFIKLEIAEIQAELELENELSAKSWSVLFKKPSSRKRLVLGCGIQLAGQFSGINVINYYSPRIYAALNIDTQTSLMIIGISGAMSIITCAIGLWLLEGVGRVKPLVISCYGMACALLINAVLSQTIDPSTTTNHDALRASVSMNFLISFFYTPLGVNSWVYPAEIFNTETRARGSAMATVTNWIFNLLFAQVSPIALEAIGYRYFYLFMVLNILDGTIFWLFYPETRGKTLEQIGALFGDQVLIQNNEIMSTSSDNNKEPDTVFEKEIHNIDPENNIL